MTALGASALEQALALLRAPGMLAAVRERRFPDDLLPLLRLAAGDATTAADAMLASGESAPQVREAAKFYIQQVMFTPGIDSYRVLGVNRDAPEQRIKDHYRLLVRWLHPDRNADHWEGVYVDRVNAAWRDLRTEERRRDYDREAPVALAEASRTVTPARGGLSDAALQVQDSFEPRTSKRWLRFLPAAVLGSLGIAAVLALSLMYSARQEELHPPAVAISTPPTSMPVAAAEISPASPAAASTNSTASVAGTSVSSTAGIADSGAAAGNGQGGQAWQQLSAVPNADNGSEPETSAQVDIAPLPVAQHSGVASVGAAPRTPSPPPPPVPVAVANPPSVKIAPVRRAPVVSATPAAAAVALVATPAAAPTRHASARRQAPGSGASSADHAAVGTSNDAIAASYPANGDAGSTAMDDRTADNLLQRFRQAYDQGDLPQLMSLFTRNARNQSTGGVRIADTYRRMFEASDSRQLSISQPSWLVNGDTVTIIASFEASVLTHGQRRPRRVAGDIRFDLQREDGEMRIVRLSHDQL